MPSTMILEYFGAELVGGELLAARFAINFAVSTIVSRAFAAQPGMSQTSDSGVRQQVPPSNTNSIPVVYGTAYMGGTFVDAVLSTDQQTMYYVMAISHATEGGYQAFDINKMYYGDQLITFQTVPTPEKTNVLSLTDTAGNVDTKINGNLNIYLYYANEAGTITPYNTTYYPWDTNVMGSTGIDAALRWPSTGRRMNGLMFAIVKLKYNRDAGTTSLSPITFNVTNTPLASVNPSSRPGDAWYDYLTNTKYGAAMDSSIVDTVSRDALNTYATATIPYTPSGGGSATQSRYTINGVIDTSKDCLSNIDQIMLACDSWNQYNATTGKWAVVINKEESTSFAFDDSNIIGDIRISAQDINQSINQIEAQFPNSSNKDQQDFVYIQTPSNLLYVNEPVNKYTIKYELVNNSVQAQYLANRQLEQAREDLIVSINTPYPGIQVDAGDVVSITNAFYGWSAKLFRVMKVVEVATPEGGLGASLDLTEYNAQVYDNASITAFTPAPNSGLSNPNYFGPLTTPSISSNVNYTTPNFTVTVTIPSVGRVTTITLFYRVSGTTEWKVWAIQNSSTSAPFTPGSTFIFNDVFLPSASYDFSYSVSNDIGGTAVSATYPNITWTTYVNNIYNNSGSGTTATYLLRQYQTQGTTSGAPSYYAGIFGSPNGNAVPIRLYTETTPSSGNSYYGHIEFNYLTNVPSIASQGQLAFVGTHLYTSDGTNWNKVYQVGDTITPTFTAQSANTVLAGPTSGAAAIPTFRTLVAADVPTSLNPTTLTVPQYTYGANSTVTGLRLANSGNTAATAAYLTTDGGYGISKYFAGIGWVDQAEFGGSAGTNLAGNVFIGTSLKVNSVTVGRGPGAVSTNTVVGYNALNGNTTGSQNTVFGYQAGYTGNFSATTAFGYNALQNNGASYNTAFGYLAGQGIGGNGTFNVAVGAAALQSFNTGSNNVAVGYGSAGSVYAGSDNTAVGYSSLNQNSSGTYNVAVGSRALFNTTGSYNTAIGGGALQSNTTAGANTALGYQAGYSGTTNGYNLFLGYQAGYASTGGYAISIGYQAGYNNTNNIANLFVGFQTGYANTTGQNNTSIADINSLRSNTSGSYNVAVGTSALYSNTTANNNTAVGYQAAYSNTTGTGIVAIGRSAAYFNTTGIRLVAVGNAALTTSSTGTNLVGVGSDALYSNTTGSYNTGIGDSALVNNTTGNYNTAIGAGALLSNSSASNNTAVGYQSLYSNTTGSPNTAIGYQALYTNSTGSSQTAVGAYALGLNTTGIQNAATGYGALYNNTTGSYNSAFGYQALTSNTTASNGTAVGYQAGYNNTTGDRLTAVGLYAGRGNTTGNYNTFLGSYTGYGNSGSLTGNSNTGIGNASLYNLTSGTYNNGVGYGALFAVTTGSYNNAFGANALGNNTGSNNTAFGESALQANTTGNYNTAVGFQALYNSNSTGVAGNNAVGNTAIGSSAGANLTTGYGNTLVGGAVGASLTTGIGNTFIGPSASGVYPGGYFMTTGSKNTIIGSFSGNQGGLNITTANNYIVLSDGDGNPRGIFDGSGNFLVGKTAANITTVGAEIRPTGFIASTLAGSTNATDTLEVYSTGASAYRFYVTMDGKINCTSTTIAGISDVRFKENIRDLDVGLNAIMALKPRTFDWKEGIGKNIKNDRGFIAQEFELIFPDLIGHWKDEPPDGDEPYKTVSPDLIPVLVKAIQELKTELDAYKAAHP